jgi:hypothetical protein
LILSYILHGHIPYYSGKHHDELLDTKLSKQRGLLNVTPDVYAHMQYSIRYSSQALPINTLLDTLVRPNADTELNPTSCVLWKHEAKKAVSHIVLTGATEAGGQWVTSASGTSDEIGTLSYAEMLSLPGYSFGDHHLRQYGTPLQDFQRPSRAQVASYYAAYPTEVGISSTFHPSTAVSRVTRTSTGFHIAPANINCSNLVLATGIFNVTTPPPPFLSPFTAFDSCELPLLVIGSGFSAADAIISAPPSRKIIHIFKWDPENRPSPLRACHHQAYPDYAGIYRQMKGAAALSAVSGQQTVLSPILKKKGNPFFKQRDWRSVYEGLPNAAIDKAYLSAGKARLSIRLDDGRLVERIAGGLAYQVGRRGSLEYLDPALRTEVVYCQLQLPPKQPFEGLLNCRTLRSKAEADLEVAPNVFITGSLTGDSLVRHAFGACLYAAGKIMGVQRQPSPSRAKPDACVAVFGPDGGGNSDGVLANGSAHADLHVDRRELLTEDTS